MHSLCEIFFEKHEIPSNGGLLNKQVLAQQSRFWTFSKSGPDTKIQCIS